MFTRLLPNVAGVCGGVVVGWLIATNNKTADSWTTNYSPSVAWDWNWDKREPSSLQEPNKKKRPDVNNNITSNTFSTNATDDTKHEILRSKSTRYLILVRHGQYNLEGSTDQERILTKLGREQAKLTGMRLAALDLPITRMVHSTMARATETARIMMEHMPPIADIETSDLIREGAPIPPEPAQKHWRPETHQFYSDGPRIEAGFRRYFHRAPASQTEDTYDLVVCHANVIRFVVCRALQFPPEAWLRMSLHNGSITLLCIRPDGRVSMRQLGDCGHMPPQSLSLT